MILYESNGITVRTLEIKDQKHLVSWLNDPLVLTYYEGRDRPHDLELIKENFYTNDEEEKRCLIEYNHKPIGYIQFYLIDEETCKKFGYYDLNETIYGTDQFIGETKYWNQGIGKQLMKSMIKYLTHELGADRILMDPQTWNLRAITCYERCGFKKIMKLENYEMHEGELRDCWLMEYSKEDILKVDRGEFL
ncbi:GNAT family N-acetyltransferase [Paenibacillus sp. MY03]|uniref:GNAT family N-acetyltransferase n=1 Tax=Paenibacillus sp. MY03 TaxID=302980 RepID=UPI000B3CC9B8|nr:GNAT family N-acetyltransferase [Paenibacillus sp. MY03]OUS76103.1 GNAT family N-acetyltransferase [Paenibacillus sp. MY03]